MPNWVDNELYVRGPAKRLAQVRETLEAQDSLLDFNKVIPMPRGYNYVVSPAPSTPNGEAPYNQWLKTIPSGVDVEAHLIEFLEAEKVDCDPPSLSQKARTYVSYLSACLRALYGYPSWYEWCCENWGTKWGANRVKCVQTKSSLQYRFDTAWSQPIPVIKHLVTTHPDLKFVAKAWDGGAGWKRVVHGAKGETVVGASASYHGKRGG